MPPKSRIKRVEPLKKDLPIYPIGAAAKLLDVHPRTLRIYEDEGLIKPHRQGGRRMYSQNDLQWLACLRSAIHDQGISIPGVKKLLRFATCYEIVECSDSVACTCDAVVDRVIPRKVHLAGDAATAKKLQEDERKEREKQRTKTAQKSKSTKIK